MIEILHPGFLTTVQDGGRYGYQRFGVPVCGAMDAFALSQANILAGNPPEEAALEITALGPQIRFTEDTVFALAGADFCYTLNDRPLKNGGAYFAQAGEILTCGSAQNGFRAYIAFPGGLDLPRVMSSRSTCLSAHFGGFHGRALQKGDCIGLRCPQLWLKGLESRTACCHYDSDQPLRVVLGPQEDAFFPETIEQFFREEYRMSANCDRMGCRLEGTALPLRGSANIISDGIAMGAIQIPDGKPIIMMADRQTTGGYVKLGTVITADLPLAAQKKPGDAVHFAPVTVCQAQQILREKNRSLRNWAESLEDQRIW